MAHKCPMKSEIVKLLLLERLSSSSYSSASVIQHALHTYTHVDTQTKNTRTHTHTHISIQLRIDTSITNHVADTQTIDTLPFF